MLDGKPIPKEKKGMSLGYWRRKCDALMQEIGTRDNPQCTLCNQPCNVMHHFFPKSVSAYLRYDWRNLIPLCNGCHNRLHQSGDPSYEQRIISIRGQPWYDELDKVRRTEIKVNVGYYRNVKAELEKML